MRKKSTLVFIGLAALGIIMSFFLVWFQANRIEKRSDASQNEALSDRVIATLESRFAVEPDNVEYAVGLTAAYLQKIRETGNASLYEKIEKTLDIVSEYSPRDSRILAKRAEVSNGRHDFQKGLEYIEDALKINPDVATFYGIKSDSLLELGRYDEAETSLQTMVDMKPDFSSYSRIAYLRELHGDSEGALEALKAAIGSGSTYPENIAWAYVESGKLLIPYDLEGARLKFDQALNLSPSYAPALEGLGRIAYAEGKKDDARTFFTKAFESLPIAEYATGMANFYRVEGDETKAKQYYALAETAYQESSGVNVDQEYSLFLADHGDTREAHRLALFAYQARPSIYGADAYAWALLKNGSKDEAEKYIEEALRLGGHDPVIQYHAGMISEANGKSEEARSHFARAEEINQHSSLLYSKSITEKIR